MWPHQVPSLEGASRDAPPPGFYADAAGQVGVRPTVVDREGPPDAGATGTRRAGRRGPTALQRGGDGHKLNRRVRPVDDDHLSHWQALIEGAAAPCRLAVAEGGG